MTDPGVQPALSRERWERELADNTTFWLGRDRHALAALALYQQPFGFTARDVKRLNVAALFFEEALRQVGGESWANIPLGDFPADFRSLAARIEALLPPEEK